MTTKKHHDTKKSEADVASPEVKTAPEGAVAPMEGNGTTPVPADETAVPVVPVPPPTPRPTAVGGIGSVVAPASSEDLAGVVREASAHPGPVCLIVRNESDAGLVRKMLSGGKYHRGVKIKPNQGVRIMWRAVNNG
jgi:hypothetical protein